MEDCFLFPDLTIFDQLSFDIAAKAGHCFGCGEEPFIGMFFVAEKEGL